MHAGEKGATFGNFPNKKGFLLKMDCVMGFKTKCYLPMVIDKKYYVLMFHFDMLWPFKT